MLRRLISRCTKSWYTPDQWRVIRLAHENLGLDFEDEDDAKRFRASARNRYRELHPECGTEAYSARVYLNYAMEVTGGPYDLA